MPPASMDGILHPKAAINKQKVVLQEGGPFKVWCAPACLLAYLLERKLALLSWLTGNFKYFPQLLMRVEALLQSTFGQAHSLALRCGFTSECLDCRSMRNS
jgi:hypothetical protein